MSSSSVLVRVDGDRRHRQLVRRPENSDRNFLRVERETTSELDCRGRLKLGDQRARADSPLGWRPGRFKIKDQNVSASIAHGSTKSERELWRTMSSVGVAQGEIGCELGGFANEGRARHLFDGSQTSEHSLLRGPLWPADFSRILVIVWDGVPGVASVERNGRGQGDDVSGAGCYQAGE